MSQALGNPAQRPELESLRVERTNGAVVLTLNRPERRNALSRQTLTEVGAVGRSLRAEDRVVVVTGAGDRAFCAGADLKERKGMSPDAIRAQLLRYRTELGWLSRCAVPTVAAINGAAVGGGLELALLCDLRICVPAATFALPETGLGIIPAAGGTQTLPRVVGMPLAKEMILLGRRLTAAEALSAGLVHRVVADPELLLQSCLEWLHPVLEGAPIAQRAALQALRSADALPLEQGLQAELECYEPCLLSEDRSEALEAFASKRKPCFRGR